MSFAQAPAFCSSSHPDRRNATRHTRPMNIDELDGSLIQALSAGERAAQRGGTPGRRQFAAAIHKAYDAGLTAQDINHVLGGTLIDISALADEYPPTH